MRELEGLGRAITSAAVDMVDVVATGALDDEGALAAWQSVHGALLPEFSVSLAEMPEFVQQVLHEAMSAATTLAVVSRQFVGDRMGEEAAVELMQVFRAVGGTGPTDDLQ